MNLTTRDLLVELLLKAFDEPVPAEAVHARMAALVKQFPSEQAEVTKKLNRYVVALEDWGPFGGEEVRRSELETFGVGDCSELKDSSDLKTRPISSVSSLRSSVSGPPPSAREVALRKAALLFNHHLFFEVHEVLEAQWRREHDPPRLFLQGLIQVAVAFYHLERHNFRGAVSLLHDGLEKIMPYRPSFLGVELQEFVTRLLACYQELQRLGPEHCDQLQDTRIPPFQIQVG